MGRVILGLRWLVFPTTFLIYNLWHFMSPSLCVCDCSCEASEWIVYDGSVFALLCASFAACAWFSRERGDDPLTIGFSASSIMFMVECARLVFGLNSGSLLAEKVFIFVGSALVGLFISKSLKKD